MRRDRPAALLLLAVASIGCAQTVRYAVSIPESSLPPARHRLPKQYTTIPLDRAKLTLSCKNFVMTEQRVSPIQLGPRAQNDTLYSLVPVFVGVEVAPGSGPIDLAPADFGIVTTSGDTLHPREYLGPGEPWMTDFECICGERDYAASGRVMGVCYDCFLRPRTGTAVRQPPSKTLKVAGSSCVVLFFERFQGLEFRLLAGGIRRAGATLDVPATRFVAGYWNEYRSVP